MIAETIKDYEKEIVASTIGVRQGFFEGSVDGAKSIGVRQGFFEGSVDGAKSIGDAFDEMAKWVDEYYS
jgi:CRISPR-associated protein Cst2